MSRRLIPIYDAIDAGNYKQSIKMIRQCESSIRPGSSTTELQVLYALKAMSLSRMDRIDEAKVVIQQLMVMVPTDPAVLDTMIIVFKQIDRLDWNLATYEAAVKVAPKNEALLIGLYFAHLRNGHAWLKQQQVAMLLYRTFGLEKYARWAALCIEIQHGGLRSLALPAFELKPAKTLVLAELILAKHDSNKPMPVKRLQQYIRVLERQLKHGEIVALLSDKNSVSSMWPSDDVDRRFQYATSLFRSGSFAECSTICASVLSNLSRTDNWQFLSLYVKAQKRVSPDVTRTFLHDLQKVSPDKRGPFLAEIDLCCIEIQDGTNAKANDCLAVLMLDYFERFGTLRSLFHDFKPYFSHVPHRDQFIEQLSDRTKQLNLSDVDGKASAERCIRRLVSLSLCQRMLSAQPISFTETHRASVLRSTRLLLEEYQASVNAGTSLEPTEMGPGDDLAIVLVHQLIDLWQQTSSVSYIFDAIIILERALQSTPSNFQFRLTLVRLYVNPDVGAFAEAFAHFQKLDVKSVQMDTLSHLIQDDALRYGFFGAARSIAEDVIRFHNTYNVDAADLITLAYRMDNLDQVLDFHQFHDRLERSSRLVASHRVIKLCDVMDVIPESYTAAFLAAPLGQLSDNTDRDAIFIPENGSRSIVFNLPAPFPCSSSWAGVDVAPEISLAWHDTIISLHKALSSDSQPSVIRSSLSRFNAAAAQLHLYDNAIDLAPQVSVEFSSSSLTHQHFSLCLLTVETTACVLESWEAAQSFLDQVDGFNQNEVTPTWTDYGSQVDDNTMRWNSVQRQLEVIQILLGGTVEQLINGLSVTNPAPVLPLLVQFACGAASYIVQLIKAAAASVPARRAFAKARKGRAKKDRSPDAEQIEDNVLQAILETRVVLRNLLEGALKLLRSLRECLQQYVIASGSAGENIKPLHMEPSDAFRTSRDSEDLLANDRIALSTAIAMAISESHQASISSVLAILHRHIEAVAQMKL